MPSLGPTELIIILVIVLLLFGAGKLATLGGALGRGVKDFRSAMKTDEGDDEAEPTPARKVTAKAAADESQDEA
jgi:sec-independent protein translocase protein TatA